MAVAFDRKLGEVTAAAAAVTLTAPGIVSGDFIVIWIACDNTAGVNLPNISNVTIDTVSQTFSVVASHGSSSSTADAATRGFIIVVPSASRTSTSNISVSFSATPSKAVGLFAVFTGVTDTVSAGPDSVSSPTTPTGFSAPAGDLMLVLTSCENNGAMTKDTDTLGGVAYSEPGGDGAVFTTGGGAASNVSLLAAYKIPTSTASQVWNAGSTSGDGGQCSVSLAAASSGTPISGSDTGAGADATSTLTATLSGTDTGSGVDIRSALTATLSATTDTGVFAEASSVAVTGSDTGTFVDNDLNIAVTGTDTGTGTDVRSALTATLTGTDTGTGVDADVDIRVAGSDTGLGTDAHSSVGLSGSDTGLGTDTHSNVAVTGSDTGSGADASSVDTGGGTPVSGADTGTAVDAASTTATLTGADTGSAVDTGSVSATLAGSDTASGVDASSLTVIPPTGTDTGSAADTGSVAATLTGADTAAAVDAGSVAASVAGSDTGSGVDVRSSLVATLSGSDTATAVDAASVSVSTDTPVSGSDSFTAVESASVVVTLSAGETITSAETSVIGVTGSDSTTLTDARTLVGQPVGTDTGTGVDAKTVLTAAVLATDRVTATESVRLTALIPYFVDPVRQEHVRPVMNAIDRVGNASGLTVYRIGSTWYSGQHIRQEVLDQADIVYRGGYEYPVLDSTVQAQLIAAGYSIEVREVVLV